MLCSVIRAGLIRNLLNTLSWLLTKHNIVFVLVFRCQIYASSITGNIWFLSQNIAHNQFSSDPHTRKWTIRNHSLRLCCGGTPWVSMIWSQLREREACRLRSRPSARVARNMFMGVASTSSNQIAARNSVRGSRARSPLKETVARKAGPTWLARAPVFPSSVISMVTSWWLQLSSLIVAAISSLRELISIGERRGGCSLIRADSLVLTATTHQRMLWLPATPFCNINIIRLLIRL